VWVGNEYASTLMKVTAADFRLAATVPLRGAPLGLAYVGDDLWFTTAGGSALHRGGVLTLVGMRSLSFDDVPVTDPTLHYGQYDGLAELTNDGLVGFNRAAGVDGARIVPDLATTLPTPTDGGLTYTFHLHNGVRYSTGAPVLAGDIRRGIERAVVHPETSAGDYYAKAIVGAQACENAAAKAQAARQPRPDCHLNAGIVTDDRRGTVTLHLNRPTPEFLYQLALPNASAVPEDTPVDLPAGTYLPSTGPYMFSSYIPARAAKGGRAAFPGRLELIRNPRFHVWSSAAQPDGYPDRIIVESVSTDQQAITQVTSGRADLLFGGASTDEADRVRERHGSQLHQTPGTFTQYLYLDTRRPPFSNRDARRAVAYALDRKALISSQLGDSAPTTCQLIPPHFAAYVPYCPFTFGGGMDGKWTAPNIETAQALVRKSGTLGAKVVLISYDDKTNFKPLVEQTRAALTSLGYRVSMRWLQFPDYPPLPAEKQHYDWNIGLMGWSADYPAASNYLAAIGACDRNVGFFNLSRFCDPKIETQVQAALAQQATDPGAATAAWTHIDRMMVDAAAVIPFGTNVESDFVSSRVGNVLIRPMTGPLIDQMWVQ
jgi:peptide/nickel transport system substrate-binding protein